MNNNEKEILRNFKINIALSNFEREQKERNFLKNREKVKFINMINKKKRIILTTCAGFILISGIVFAVNNENIKKYFRGIGKGIDSAIENGYIENTEMNYMSSNVDAENMPNNKAIEDIKIEAKIDNFLMDDCNISTEISFKFDDKINNYIDLDNIHNIELKDLIVRDEENKILFSGIDKENFEKYCEKYKLNYIYGECNENYYNSGLNRFLTYNNKEEKSVRLIYNMYADGYPKSKKLYFSFGKIVISEHNNEEVYTFKGNWEIELDVPEKMYNRTTQSYKVINCSDDNIKVYTTTVSDTGCEIGLIIDNIEEPTFPEEIYKKFQETNNSEEVLQDETLANKLHDYLYKASPIDTTDKETYIENSNGKKFNCTLSVSRKYKKEWITKNKCDFYETFSMTKNDMTDKIIVSLKYYEKIVTIELEKIKN